MLCATWIDPSHYQHFGQYLNLRMDGENTQGNKVKENLDASKSFPGSIKTHQSPVANC